jgi:xanthine dehydrogenase YagR molybdenum-binding subunit
MKLGRPVKVAQTRRQMFANAPHRGEAIQRIRLGAEKSGKLVAVAHDAVLAMARYYPFAEPACSPTRGSYATPNLQTTHRVVPLDIPKCDSMRAPGDAIGSVALECAMDELAHELGMDPLELRLLNEPSLDPAKEIPFASRDLERCLREGAARFGWNERRVRPGSHRDGRFLVGTGMATAIRSNFLQPASARVRLGGNGQATAQLDMTDIGTGTYTILTQIVADELQIPVERVVVELGDSNFPQTAGSGGSFGAASSGSALKDACRNLRAALVEAARNDEGSALHGIAADLIAVEGDRLTAGGVSDSIAAIIRCRGKPIMAEGSVKPGPEHKEYAQYSYGAHFVDVGVDADTGETRIRRMTGVFSFGRILNRKTARSQLIGGMVWGIGTALHEESVMDPRNGAFVNRDLAEYHVPVNRDIPALDIVMLEEPDEKASPLGSKGVGELAICGAAAAVGNAIFNATGIRIRDFPITLDKLVTRLG